MTMGLEEVVLTMFTVCNGARVFAYLPQMRLIRRDRNGAAAVSYTTWGVFGASHLSTAAYALIISHDWHMVLAFGVNAAGSFLIIAMAVRQKRRLRRDRTDTPAHPPVSPAQASSRPRIDDRELLSYFGPSGPSGPSGRPGLTPSN